MFVVGYFEPDARPAMKPSRRAFSTASSRELTPSLRYAECACVVTVVRVNSNWSPISASDSCVGSSPRTRSSAALMEDGPRRCAKASGW